MGETYYKKRNNFSEAHYKLPRSYGMFDIDDLKGEWLRLSDNITSDIRTTYVEYRCLKFEKDDNRFNLDRIKFTAIFEYKYTGNDYLKQKIEMNSGEPLWATFMLAKLIKCKFFLLVATNGDSPYHFIEFDINTNRKLPYKTLNFDYKIDNPNVVLEFWNNELNIT